MDKKVKLGSFFWQSHAQRNADFFKFYYSSLIENYEFSRDFFTLSYANVVERERLANKFVTFYGVLLLGMVLSDISGSGEVSILGMNLPKLFEYRGFFLFLLANISLIYSLLYLDTKTRRAILNSLYEMQKGEGGRIEGLLKWGNIIEYDFSAIHNFPRQNIFIGPVTAWHQNVSIFIALVWFLGLLSCTIGSLSYLYFLEICYPSVDDSSYWFFLIFSIVTTIFSFLLYYRAFGVLQYRRA